MMIAMAFVMFVITRASLTRIREVFEEEVDIKEKSQDSISEVKDGSISFNNVSFSYLGKKDN